ncbi:hypothetical protein F5Y16DRAFT_420467 [Xylariaceae sp. FL0255]|nr:hypothetical protein F5Y16DRAFT_420467 [Xylariaceae sp. FL0255]
MSAAKFEYPTYKLFEPRYYAQRPIILDVDAIESPDTVVLQYEEEIAGVNSGDLRGDSPRGLLAIEACPKQQPPPMHSFDSPRSYQDPQYQYSTQPFAAQQTENAAAAQLNLLAFAANGATSQYMTPVVPTVISYQPTNGVFGTKVLVKISAAYDILAVTSQFYLAFGSHKSPAQAIRDASDASGFGYVVSGDAPHLEDTRVLSESVPLSLIIESTDGQPLVEVGTFTYHDTQVGSSEGPHEDITRGASRSPVPKQEDSPHIQPQDTDQLSEAAASTNTYGYAPTVHQAVASSYDAAGYPSNNSNDNNNMLSTYHRPAYGADYPRAPSLLKAPSWAGPYGSSLTSPRSPRGIHHTSIPRPSITTLPIPTSREPRLIRTSTLQTPGPSTGQLSPYALYTTKAQLKINGDLESMASNWTQEECENGRRLVLFHKKQQGPILSTTFKPVSVSERPPNSICISCIYWNEKRECYVTSVDTISLLEQLVASPSRFTVEEKNRIRRNLEGFRPLTVSKAKPDSEEFFKTIMGFGNPKPRNIEKDVKVFPWKILAPALKKIISKYSASPPSPASNLHHSGASFHPSSGPPALLTPVSSTSPGLYGPPHTPAVADTGYTTHHDSHTMASPRSLTGAPSSWGPYTARTLSPSLKSHSPHQTTTGGGGSMRIPSLPAYGPTDLRHHSAQSYGMSSHRWDTTAVTTNGYGDGPAPSAYTNHHSHVYGTGAYGSSGHHRE